MKTSFKLISCAAFLLLATRVSVSATTDSMLYSNLAAKASHQLRTTDFGIAIPIRDFYRTCTTGTRLPLFQENELYYIAKVSTLEHGEQLCAFPKVDHSGMGTAWVTNEKLLIFGRPTRSCAGKLYLLKGEALPIIEDAESEYVVLVERYGQSVPFGIPRFVTGITHERIHEQPVQQKVVKSRKPKPRRVTVDMNAFEDITGHSASRRSGGLFGFGRSRSKESSQQKEDVSTSPPQSKPKPKAEAQPEPPPEKIEKEPVAEKVEKTKRARPRITFRVPVTMIVLQVFVLALIVQVFLILRKHREAPASKTAKPMPVVEDYQSYSTMGESMASNYLQDLAHEAGDFSGSLEGFSLTELVQFLHSAQETGSLVIKDASDTVSGQFFFKGGEIIDAVYGKSQGEDAVYDLFKSSDASFSFHRKSVDGRSHTISQQTMGLLLEASKTYDEERGLT